MKYIDISVPFGIKYISNWKEYDIPTGHCIVDKGVTGCGYTELCLVNDHPVVLCSPRKLLLLNKEKQHHKKKDLSVLYLRNEIKNYEDVRKFKESVRHHIEFCLNELKKAPKLLVTYDSSHYVIDALRDLGVLDSFYFIVDEFQSIFLDSYYKSEVEFDFIEYLKTVKNVIYLSATPMLDKYLCLVDEFKDLPFYRLDWSKTGVVETLIVQRRFTSSLFTECKKIICDYIDGKFPIKLNELGEIITSNEAVFYFNSITDIIKLIHKLNLKPEQVNIICADVQDNITKLNKLSKEMGCLPTNKFEIGEVPIEGETNKMFTFCTKTAYIGADFYSTCASTYVFADPNIDSLALDISLDLPQIAGRQRLRENPFKNNIIIFYKTIRKSEMESKELFDKKQDERRRTSNILLKEFFNMSEEGRQKYTKKLLVDISVSQYSDDFISISKKTGVPVYNKFIEIANERAWEVAQKDYQDKISVTRVLDEVAEVTEYKTENEIKVQRFLDNQFYRTGIFKEKMRLYCEFVDENKDNSEIITLLYFRIKDPKYKDFYDFYGTSGCRAVRYEEKQLIEGMKNLDKKNSLTDIIYTNFKLDNRYTLKEIKQTLKKIYQEFGITSTPKATDLNKYFKLERTRVKSDDKFVEGFKLTKLKEQ